MAIAQRRENPLPDRLRRQLDAAHSGLLHIHKTLLDHERARYERANGPVGGPVDFLQLVIRDPWFNWLHPISELVVQIDEFTWDKNPRDPKDGEALVAQAHALLTPAENGDEFQREYHRSVQESPEVAAAHGKWRQSVEAERSA
jgi:hypothetical protein